MGEKTWDLESAIKFRIEELEIEKVYWDDLVKSFHSNTTSAEDIILYKTMQNNRDLAIIKIIELNNKLTKL